MQFPNKHSRFSCGAIYDVNKFCFGSSLISSNHHFVKRLSGNVNNEDVLMKNKTCVKTFPAKHKQTFRNSALSQQCDYSSRSFGAGSAQPDKEAIERIAYSL